MYEIPEDHPVFGKSQTIIRLADGAAIPIDPANSDYQRYLRWLENPEADEAQSL